MNEDQARQRIATVFAKYVQPHLPSADLGEADLLDEKPMDLEAEVDGFGAISVIEKSVGDDAPRISIAARQPESLARGAFYTLISVYPAEVGYEKALEICAAVNEDGVFFRHMDDNEEMTPADFLVALKQWQQEENEE